MDGGGVLPTGVFESSSTWSKLVLVVVPWALLDGVAVAQFSSVSVRWSL